MTRKTQTTSAERDWRCETCKDWNLGFLAHSNRRPCDSEEAAKALGGSTIWPTGNFGCRFHQPREDG